MTSLVRWSFLHGGVLCKRRPMKGFRFLSSVFRFSTVAGRSPKMAKLMSSEYAQEVISNVDNFLFDCDGVLWDGNGPIEGSLDTIKKLKKLGKRVFYVTNNSSLARSDYVEKCARFGFPAEEKDIVCTAYVAAEYLKKVGFKGKVYLVGKEESLGKELTTAGFSYIGPGPDLVNNRQEQWLQTELDPEVNCVLVGFDPHINYTKLVKACSYLQNPNCLFLATNEDGRLPVEGPIRIPGTGCMVAPIKCGSERVPTIMGKPETNMFEVLSTVNNFDVSRTMMVGDRYETDIVFAEKCGMKYSLLVLTGCATQDDVDNKRAVATFYAPRLEDMGKHL